MAIEIRNKEDLLEQLTFYPVGVDDGYYIFCIQNEVRLSKLLLDEMPVEHIVELINNHFLTIMKEAPLVYISDDQQPADNCSFSSIGNSNFLERVR